MKVCTFERKWKWKFDNIVGVIDAQAGQILSFHFFFSCSNCVKYLILSSKK